MYHISNNHIITITNKQQLLHTEKKKEYNTNNMQYGNEEFCWMEWQLTTLKTASQLSRWNVSVSHIDIWPVTRLLWDLSRNEVQGAVNGPVSQFSNLHRIKHHIQNTEFYSARCSATMSSSHCTKRRLLLLLISFTANTSRVPIIENNNNNNNNKIAVRQ